jgi:hypothetical protein
MNQNKDPQTGRPEETKAAADEAKPQEKPEEKQAETAKPEQAAAPEPETAKEAETSGDKKKKKEGPSFFQSEKFKHGSTATAFTAIFIVVIILLNVVVSILSNKFPSINFDVTKSANNSLSTEALQIVDKVKTPVEITICASKQACEQNSVQTDSNSTTDYAQVSRLFSKAAERNSKITLQYVDLDKNPMFASGYKSDNLTAGDVVVKSDKRHRVLTASDLFSTQYSSDGTTSTSLSNVDSSLASALNSVTSDSMPVAAFDTGHSEKMDTTGYKHLLTNNSFETKDFSLLTDKIPDKTQLLVLGCPQSDLTDAEIDKVEAFLHDKTSKLDRSVLITYSAGQGSLQKLGSYLGEWGLAVDASSAVEETSSQKYYSSPLNIFSNVQTTLSLGGSGSYSNFLTPYVCPVTIKAQNVGSKTTYALAKSSDTSVVYKTSGNTSSASQAAAQTLAALSQETLTVNGKSVHANVIVSGSTMMFSSDLLSSSVIGNSSYLTDLSRYATGTNNESTKITTTTRELYAKDIASTSQSVMLLGYGVFTILIPLIVAIAGIVVYRKRRAL